MEIGNSAVTLSPLSLPTTMMDYGAQKEAEGLLKTSRAGCSHWFKAPVNVPAKVRLGIEQCTGCWPSTCESLGFKLTLLEGEKQKQR